MRVASLLLAVLALAFAGCGGDEETLPPEAPGAETEPLAPEVGTDEQPPPGPETDDEAAPGEAGPTITSCQTVQDAGGGRYEIEGVGAVVIRQEGNRLHLDSVEPAEGWRHEVDDRDDDEVEVEFFREGERLDFEAELEDGRIEAEICPDDD